MHESCQNASFIHILCSPIYFIPFIISVFSPFIEALQVRDTAMCDSSRSVVYAAICAYNVKAKALKGKKSLFVGLGK